MNHTGLVSGHLKTTVVPFLFRGTQQVSEFIDTLCVQPCGVALKDEPGGGVMKN